MWFPRLAYLAGSDESCLGSGSTQSGGKRSRESVDAESTRGCGLSVVAIADTSEADLVVHAAAIAIIASGRDSDHPRLPGEVRLAAVLA